MAIKRYSITFLLLALAITLYVVGAVFAATALLVLGMVAEMAFWVRLFGRKRRD